MTLNLTKTKAMMLTLSANSKPPHITSPLDIVESWKFLGVFIDRNLTFNDHIDYVTSKAKQRFYWLLQLKRLSVSTDKLTRFYLCNIRSVLVYCIAAFFSLLNDKQKSKLERIQRLCTKIILPHIESYTDRLAILGIPSVFSFSENQYR